MTPPISIGSQVEIIGPTREGKCYPEYTKFVVSWIRKDDDNPIVYSANLTPWYPASSLRLVEELKICDYVQIVGLSTSGDANFPGTIGQIERTVGTKFIVDKSPYFYPPESLRKLTPEEIQQYQTAQMLPKPTEIQELRRRIHDLEMSLDGFTNGPEPEYVSGISHVEYPLLDRVKKTEQEQSAIINQLHEVKESHANRSAVLSCDIMDACKRLSTIEKRLDVLEGEMPEVIDRDQIRIPENACISMRSDQNGKVSIDYSDGGFELAKAVLDSMREE